MNKLETRIPPPLIAIVIGLVMWQLIPAAMSVEEGALIRQSIAAIVAFIGLACD
ncbi:MAG: isoprenylcysteine carboxylmethyltransferase family protein, partial [Alcaligenaceae bacterium]|nr:isoprenylcysteine carboxylmethyltransferase family protein [Alcaligenaceae bacterium]